MRLIVEPAQACRESYSGAAATPGGGSAGRALAFRVERQKLEKWCWAAAAVSLGAWYGERPGWSQERLAGEMLGPGTDGNQDAQLDQALRKVGCFSHWSPGRPAFERIVTEIEAGRPLCPCIEWRRGGTHYVVISGYFSSYFTSGNRRDLHVEDPMDGSSVQPYDDFPGAYRLEGGFWRGVFWTGREAPASN